MVEIYVRAAASSSSTLQRSNTTVSFVSFGMNPNHPIACEELYPWDSITPLVLWSTTITRTTRTTKLFCAHVFHAHTLLSAAVAKKTKKTRTDSSSESDTNGEYSSRDDPIESFDSDDEEDVVVDCKSDETIVINGSFEDGRKSCIAPYLTVYPLTVDYGSDDVVLTLICSIR